MDGWQRLGLAVGRPIQISVQRDIAGETADAGHLAMQELVLRLGRGSGYTGSFELATKPAEPWRSADVGLAAPIQHRLIRVECWNTIGDVGASARSSARAQAELADLAMARWGRQRRPAWSGSCGRRPETGRSSPATRGLRQSFSRVLAGRGADAGRPSARGAGPRVVRRVGNAAVRMEARRLVA